MNESEDIKNKSDEMSDILRQSIKQVREADVEENIGGVRVECRRLKDFKKTQFHFEG